MRGECDKQSVELEQYGYMDAMFPEDVGYQQWLRGTQESRAGQIRLCEWR